MMAKKKGWSYNAGEKGKSWARAYEKPNGSLMAEWFEIVDGRRKRQRLSLARFGITTRAAAVEKVEAMAAGFADLDPGAPAGPLTLGRLLDWYLKEVTPGKCSSQQMADRRYARVFRAYFGEDALPERLGRQSYDAFRRDRKAGRVPGGSGRPVRDQTVLASVVFLRAVFNWATVEREDGRVLLPRNPWHGFPLPREKSPRRPEMTEELHARLIEHSPDWRHALAMELCRETRRRLSAVAHLRWSDVDLEARTVRWLAGYDKARKESVTPLSTAAVEALRRAPRGIGDAWVLPSPRDSGRPVPKDTLIYWMTAAKRRAGIEIEGLGYHGEKRAGVRDPAFRRLPPTVQEALAGTRYDTLRKVYDYVGLDAMREAVEEMERRRA
ncbi:MAG TPA: tyrosine-type recombinase/integrase [Longimicrobiaceae bacterium]|nr:tyrosine-type recombinase/integrase [Longimicrobiaceae bacterium]